MFSCFKNVLPFLFPLLLLVACSDEGDDFTGLERTVSYGPPIEKDWEVIQAGDTLRVLTTYNATSYFLYRGQPMGHEYELMQHFADANDLVLQPIVVSDRDSLFFLLNHGVGDVVAARVIPGVVDTAGIAFTQAIFTTRPTIVQRTADPDGNLPAFADSLIEAGPPTADAPKAAARATTPDTATSSTYGNLPKLVQLSVRPVRTPEQLADKRVHLRDDSPYYERLIELEDSISGDIYIVELEDASSEEAVIRMVAEGVINFTVAPENIAALNESYYQNLEVQPALGETHRIAWAIRKNAPQLEQVLNEFIEDNAGLRKNLYQKYYVDRQGFRERVEDAYLTSETGRLSAWDDLFRQAAPAISWDWRLLAAQCYQESRFEADARSWAGAMGLLQLMPATAREVNVNDPYDPQENVAGAVRYLQFLEDHWRDKVADDKERRKFILASYNAGFGHVADARRLTAKYGGDDQVWDDVAYWLLQKSKARYYRDPVVKYGFCRGLEPVTYVSRILDRYEHYRQFIEPEAGASAAGR